MYYKHPLLTILSAALSGATAHAQSVAHIVAEGPNYIVKGSASDVMISADGRTIAYFDNNPSGPSWEWRRMAIYPMGKMDSGLRMPAYPLSNPSYWWTSPSLNYYAIGGESSDGRGNRKAGFNLHLYRVGQPESAVVTYPAEEGFLPLAVMDDSEVLATNCSWWKEDKKSASSFRRAKNLYRINAATGSKSVVRKGQLTDKLGLCFLTPDNSTLILIGDEVSAVSLRSGTRTVLPQYKPAPVPESGSRTDWAVGNTHFVQIQYHSLTNETHIQFFSLATGAPGVSATLRGWCRPQVLTGAVFYAIDNDSGIIHRIRPIDGAAFQTERTWRLPPASLPISADGRYSYGVLAGEKALIFPTSKWDDYNTRTYNPAAIRYDLAAGTVERIWPQVISNSRVVPPFYATYKPSAPLLAQGERHKWESINQDTRTPEARRADNLKGQRYKPGAFFKRQGTLTEKPADFIVLAFDAGTAQYTVLKREFIPARSSFFKTDDNIAFYSVEKKTLDGATLQVLEEVYGGVLVCPVCTGSGIVQEEVVHQRGGSWEQMSFNISVYTPAHVIASWKERAVCPKCSGKGVLAKP